MMPHHARSTRLPRPAALMLGICTVLSGCGHEDSPVAPPPPPPPPPPAVGWIIVVANASGQDIDDDGFGVSVNGAPPRTVAGGSAVVFSDVAPGAHEVRITDIASNCTVRDPNPVMVAVVPRQAAVVTFAIHCLAHTTGGIVVRVLTPGFQIFGVSLGGGPVVQAANGEVVFGELLPGLHAVQLHINAGPCLLNEPYTQSHSVVAGRFTAVYYTLTCPEPAGSLIVDVTTTGNNSPGTHNVYVVRNSDSYCYEGLCSTRSVLATGQVRFDRVPVGEYHVQLRSLARNCSSTPGFHTVRIALDGTTRVAFSVNCV